MKTVKDALSNAQNTIITAFYDVWKCPGSTNRTQKCIKNVPIEQFIKEYGHWHYEGWYTTGTNTADIWVFATDDYKYEFPTISENYKREYEYFLEDLDAFLYEISHVVTDEKNLYQTIKEYFLNYTEGKLQYEIDQRGLLSIWDIDESVGIKEEICSVWLPDTFPFCKETKQNVEESEEKDGERSLS